jgi:hypothetical protein
MPRVDQFWLKYSYMEDILGNYAGAIDWIVDISLFFMLSRIRSKANL